MRQSLVVCAAAVLGCALNLAAADPAPTPPGGTAVWKTVDHSFSYQGFTSHYTCDGLRDKLRQALLDLGARADLSLSTSGCIGSRPSPFPEVQIHMSVLQPVDGTAPAGAVQAQWTPVSLAGFDKLEAGDCELLHQIKDDLLPLFPTRDVTIRADCVPHELPVHVQLSAVVLKLPETMSQR